MAMRLIDETAAIVVLEVKSGSVTVGFDSAADAVHIIAVNGNVIVKSTNVIYDNCTVSSCAVVTSGSVTSDSSGNATVTTGLSQRVTVPTDLTLNGYTDTTFTVNGAASSSLSYRFW